MDVQLTFYSKEELVEFLNCVDEQTIIDLIVCKSTKRGCEDGSKKGS